MEARGWRVMDDDTVDRDGVPEGLVTIGAFGGALGRWTVFCRKGEERQAAPAFSQVVRDITGYAL
jgi:hypothetical protein